MKTPDGRFRPSRTVSLLGVLTLIVAFAAGAYVSTRVPWGTEHPEVKQGMAMRANSENDLVMFDAEDGTQLTLYADNLWWESDRTGGEGNPPCLREPGRKVDVEVGYLWIAGPSGGSRPQALWVKCL